MFCEYHYNAGASAANVIADIVALATGETTLSNLSGACHVAASSIINDIPAGWSLHDASIPSSGQIISAPHQKNASLLKYLEIYYSNGLYFKAHEDWNTTTNVGTNSTPNTNSDLEPSLSDGGILYIFSSARFLAIAGYNFSNYTQLGGVLIATEYTCNLPWDTTSIPSFCVFNTKDVIRYTSSTSYLYYLKKAYPVRAIDINNTEQTGSNAAVHLGTRGAEFNSSFDDLASPNLRLKNGTGSAQLIFWNLFLFNYPVFGPPLGYLSELCDIWVIHGETVDRFATTQKDGSNYFLIENESYYGGSIQTKFAFRKG